MDPPPPKRLKGKDPPNPPIVPEAMLLCSKCHQVDIGPGQPRFGINCIKKCRICAHCFSELMTLRTRDPSFCCPTCNESQCQSWSCETSITRSSRRGTKATVSQLHKGSLNFEIDSHLDPTRFFQNNYGGTEYDGYVSLSFASNKGGSIRSDSEIYNVTDDAANWGAAQMHLLEDILQFLHCTTVSNDKTRGPYAPPLDGSAANLITVTGIKSAALLDYSLLHRLVFSLAYGERLLGYQQGITPDSTRFQTLVCTTASVSDMICHVRSKRPGYVKIAVSAQLQAHTIPKHVYEILNQIGVCMSYQTNRRKTLKELATKLDDGINALLKAGRHDA
jgi:hypothetical protein